MDEILSPNTAHSLKTPLVSNNNSGKNQKVQFKKMNLKEILDPKIIFNTLQMICSRIGETIKDFFLKLEKRDNILKMGNRKQYKEKFNIQEQKNLILKAIKKIAS